MTESSRGSKEGIAVVGPPIDGHMSSLETSKGILEITKFGVYIYVYISVHVALTYLVATGSKTLKKIMALRPYMVYLPEGPHLPPPEELRKRAREIAQKRQQS